MRTLGQKELTQKSELQHAQNHCDLKYMRKIKKSLANIDALRLTNEFLDLLVFVVDIKINNKECANKFGTRFIARGGKR